MITSVAGDTLFCNGAASTPVSVSPGNLGGASCSEGATECAAQQATAQALLQFDSGLSLVQADNTITSNAYNYAKILTAATSSATSAADGVSGKQRAGVAVEADCADHPGRGRRLGFRGRSSLQGLGTSIRIRTRLNLQGQLLASISPALAAFYQATQELGVSNNVTTFTMSDFSRTFQPNSNTGTDHAWGSHHIVTGRCGEGWTDVWDVPDAGI